MGVVNGFVDSAAFGAIKSGTGGEVEVGVEWGATLRRETQEFLNLALVKLLQGEL